jgi:hypothetical protein
MPSGYTYGIMDGTITEFEDFAKLCIRSFGATIHMRDDAADAVYRPLEPDLYLKNNLDHAKTEYEKALQMTDDEVAALITKSREALIRAKDETVQMLEKNKVIKSRIENMLVKAYAYHPPTPEHEQIRQFMIEQLQASFKEAIAEYAQKRLIDINEELKAPNPSIEECRAELIKTAEDRLKYCNEKYQKNLEHCKQANHWCELFFESIKEQKQAC